MSKIKFFGGFGGTEKLLACHSFVVNLVLEIDFVFGTNFLAFPIQRTDVLLSGSHWDADS